MVSLHGWKVYNCAGNCWIYLITRLLWCKTGKLCKAAKLSLLIPLHAIRRVSVRGIFVQKATPQVLTEWLPRQIHGAWASRKLPCTQHLRSGPGFHVLTCPHQDQASNLILCLARGAWRTVHAPLLGHYELILPHIWCSWKGVSHREAP